MGDGRAAFGFGKQNGVGLARHNGVEIGIGQAGVEAVDAHQEARALCLRLHGLEEFQRGRARLRLAFRRDRILEIDDHGVGAARHGFVELGAAVGGDEKE